MNGSTPKRSENFVPGNPFELPLTTQCTLRSTRPLEQSFSHRFEGRSVHNSHLLCSLFGVSMGRARGPRRWPEWTKGRLGCDGVWDRTMAVRSVAEICRTLDCDCILDYRTWVRCQQEVLLHACEAVPVISARLSTLTAATSKSDVFVFRPYGDWCLLCFGWLTCS